MPTNLNSNDICKIIKACSEANVSTIELDGIKINFLTQQKEEINNNIYEQSNSLNLLDTSSRKESQKQTEDIEELDHATYQEYNQASSPYQFEQDLIREKHLND
tara:strand:+ start:37555 stop:37866 length:312 start_codon:yes stop_codon:yes gene_type:complete